MVLTELIYTASNQNEQKSSRLYRHWKVTGGNHGVGDKIVEGDGDTKSQS